MAGPAELAAGMRVVLCVHGTPGAGRSQCSTRRHRLLLCTGPPTTDILIFVFLARVHVVAVPLALIGLSVGWFALHRKLARPALIYVSVAIECNEQFLLRVGTVADVMMETLVDCSLSTAGGAAERPKPCRQSHSYPAAWRHHCSQCCRQSRRCTQALPASSGSSHPEVCEWPSGACLRRRWPSHLIQTIS